jgi:polar amino acid transport system substrate-binding protein
VICDAKAPNKPPTTFADAPRYSSPGCTLKLSWLIHNGTTLAFAQRQELQLRIRKTAAGLLLLLIGSSQLHAAEVLRMSVSSAWNLPYASFANQRLVGGIVFDLGAALGTQLAMPVSFVVLPRKRIESAGLAGEFDLRCYITPQWTQKPEHYTWSNKLWDISDVVFGGENMAEPQGIESLPQGAVISTVIGYNYPTLEASFAVGRLKREDAIDQEKVFLKLTLARTPYGVSEARALDWYLRNTPHHRLAAWRMKISNQGFQCAIPNNGQVNAKKILQALDVLLSAGQLDAILANYR